MKLLLLLSLLPVLVSSCTGGFNTFYDGQCFYPYPYGETYDDAKSLCANAYDAHLPRLYTKQDNDQFHAADSSHSPWIGLLCDGEKWVWEDGAIATYTNFYYSTEVCNSTNVNKRYYRSSDGHWYAISDPVKSTMYPICVADTRSWICDTYWLMEEGKSDELCYQASSTLTAQSQAESNCQSQLAHLTSIHDQAFNDYLKRYATSHGYTNGFLIGLKFVDGKYVWTDGSKVDYTYFAPGFPDESFGECVSMGVNLFPGKWINTDCSTPLPYMCIKPTRSYNESIPPAGCGDDDLEFFPGDEIFSPTWGSATGPALCDYALMDLDKTKKARLLYFPVTVEIVFFESNTCCDTLTIYDGLSGAKVLKTLTGYLGLTSTKVTASANSIRMEWNATSGAHVRGWHAKVGSA